MTKNILPDAEKLHESALIPGQEYIPRFQIEMQDGFVVLYEDRSRYIKYNENVDTREMLNPEPRLGIGS